MVLTCCTLEPFVYMLLFIDEGGGEYKYKYDFYTNKKAKANKNTN